MNEKLKQAIDKTMANPKNIPVSVLKPNAGEYDGLNAIGLVQAAETQYYGAERPTDSSLAKYAGMIERQTLKDAIDRAGRRR